MLTDPVRSISVDRRRRAGVVLLELLLLTDLAGTWPLRPKPDKPAEKPAITDRELLDALKEAEELAERTRRLRDRLAKLTQHARDRELLKSLEDARLGQAELKEGRSTDYERAFRSYGLDVSKLSADEAAKRLKADPRREELLAALEDWERLRADKAERTRLTAVLNALDPDPASFRNRWRKALEGGDKAALAKLADTDEAVKLAPPALVQRARELERLGLLERAVKLLREGQWRHPGDFWINFELSSLLLRGKPPQAAEAVRYLSVAVALRGDSASAWHNLSVALERQQRPDEALRACRRAMELDPRLLAAHLARARLLRQQGRQPEALEAVQQALALNPKDASAHLLLGQFLEEMGRPRDAEQAYRRALALDPKSVRAYTRLGRIHAAVGRFNEALATYRAALALDPTNADTHVRMGNVLYAMKRLEESVKLYRRALELDPKDARAWNNLGSALRSLKKSDEALACYEKALALDPSYSTALLNLAGLYEDRGRFEEAAKALEHAQERLSPQHPNKVAVERALREVRILVAASRRLSAVLKGEVKPTSAAELLTLARLCLHPSRRLYLAAVRFYTEAFTADPKTAEHRLHHRYNAACAAALAGCGQGEDAGKLDDKERARLRGQALEWLRADLNAWVKDGSPGAREWLRHWQSDPDLAGVRDKEGLAKLPEAERKEWQELWEAVEARLKQIKEKD